MNTCFRKQTWRTDFVIAFVFCSLISLLTLKESFQMEWQIFSATSLRDHVLMGNTSHDTHHAEVLTREEEVVSMMFVLSLHLFQRNFSFTSFNWHCKVDWNDSNCETVICNLTQKSLRGRKHVCVCVSVCSGVGRVGGGLLTDSHLSSHSFQLRFVCCWGIHVWLICFHVCATWAVQRLLFLFEPTLVWQL